MVRTGCSNASFRPQFVTELQPASLDKLKIPSDFMICLDDEDRGRSVASVFSPLGKRKPWHIKLIKNHSGTFFKRGWPEFSKFHKLEVGFKLVFRYEGNMIFNVKIFDLNGCLKIYHQGGEQAIPRRIGLHDSRRKSSGKCASVMKVSSSSGKQIKRKHELVTEKETQSLHTSNIRDGHGKTSKSNVKRKVNRNVISTSHLTHEKTISHYNIYKFMPLPKIFGSVPPCNLEKGMITVKNEKQESWKIQFNTGATNNLCRGWKHFCWKNDIKVGDKCTLKIISHNEILVSVSKAAKTVEAIDVESYVLSCDRLTSQTDEVAL